MSQPKNNLLIRTLSGAVYVGSVVAACILGGWYLHILFGIFTALMLYEFAQLFKLSEYAPNAILLTVFGLTIYVLAIGGIHFSTHYHESLTPIASYFVAGAIFLFIIALITFGSFEISNTTKHPIVNTALSVMALIYIVPPILLANMMLLIGPEEHNAFPLLGIFIMIWCSDTFAYLVGRKWGKTPIAKTISPNKSWEGFAGGLFFTFVAAMTIAYFLEQNDYLIYGMLAFVVSVFGLIGDLFESKIKRQLNLKDSGNIIPGHGGILDRFDSVLFVLPMSYLVVYLFLYLWP